MADEIPTDTTAEQSSPTPTPNEPPAEGGTDAPKPGEGDDAGDGDSLLGGAGSDAGDGDDSAGSEGAGEGGDDGEGKADGPPEAYDLKVTTAGEDGAEVEVPIDTELLAEATPVLKEIGLTNDQANKLAPLVVKVQERVLKAQADDFTALKAGWAKQVQDDPEIGGKNWAETEALAAKALDTFGAPSVKDADGNETNEFRALLNETGLGNHPVLVRMFRQIGEKVGEDSDIVRTDVVPQAKLSRAEILYPNDVPKQGAK